MSHHLKTFVKEYFDVISGKDKPAALLNQYIADSDAELKQHIAVFEAAFPKYEMIIDDIIEEGDTVAVRSTFKGTHKGDLMGIAPTGQRITLPVFLFYRISNEKIVEHWMSVDQKELIKQLQVPVIV